MTTESLFARFTLPLAVVIRPCRRADLPDLEWFGLFTPHRAIIHEAYARQDHGETLMLVADSNRFPVGQAWIDFTKRQARGAALLWAVRVLPPFRKQGIGSRLIAAAEEAIARAGFTLAEIGVETDNPAARRLYERLGYRFVGIEHEDYGYTTPEGAPVRVALEEWVLHKALALKTAARR
jgi:ribosomal protein S18 acetylase RimI-like enzyme